MWRWIRKIARKRRRMRIWMSEAGLMDGLDDMLSLGY